jgi:hypothetical protein
VTKRKRSQKPKRPLPEGRTGWLQNYLNRSKPFSSWVRFAKILFLHTPFPLQKNNFSDAGGSGRKRPIFPSLHPQLTPAQHLATKIKRIRNYPQTHR